MASISLFWWSRGQWPPEWTRETRLSPAALLAKDDSSGDLFPAATQQETTSVDCLGLWTMPTGG